MIKKNMTETYSATQILHQKNAKHQGKFASNIAKIPQLIKYVSDDSWVTKTLADLKSCLLQDSCPDHSQSGYGPKGDKPCENFVLFEGMRENNLI